MKRIFALLLLLIPSIALAEQGVAFKAGATDRTTYIKIIDSGDGTPETGVTSATSGLDLEYVRTGAAAVNLTESDLAAADSAHSDGGLFHVGHGVYRVDLPDAAVASGVNEVLVQGTVTGMIVLGVRHPVIGPRAYATTVEGATFNANGGRVWYVSTTGSSSNPGTLALPLDTLPNAVTAATDGDDIFLMAGTHDRGSSSTTINKRLRILGNPAQSIITSSSSSQTLNVTSGANALVLDGIFVVNTHASGHAVMLASGMHGVQILNCDMDSLAGSNVYGEGTIGTRIVNGSMANTGNVINLVDSTGCSVITSSLTGNVLATNAIGFKGDDNYVDGDLSVGGTATGRIAGNTLTGTLTKGAAILETDTDILAVKTKTGFLPSATAGASGGLFIAGSNAATTVNITGNVSGSVGSVTGAVGSVTGNVGGNVTGSVGSVVAGVTATTPDTLVSTTIATLASQTSFTLTAGSADNDAYNKCKVVITDQSTSTQKAVCRVADYVGSTRTVTLTSAPEFTVATGDLIAIIADEPIGGPFATWTVPSSRTLQVKDRGDGTFGVVGRVRMSAGEGPQSWALEFKGTALAAGDDLDSMEAPTLSGAEAANATVADYGVKGTKAQFKLTLSGSAASANTINVVITVTTESDEEFIVTVPVTVGG
jgi:hypothetical protein